MDNGSLPMTEVATQKMRADGSTSWVVRDPFFPVEDVKDNFNRANEGPPPSASWTSGAKGVTGLGEHVVSGNQLKNTAQYAYSYYSALELGDDCEAYITLASNWNGTADLALALADTATVTSASWNCYEVYVSTANTYEISKSVAGTKTVLTNGALTLSVGDSVGIRRIGNRVVLLRRPSGGGWGYVAHAVDSTHTGPYYAAVYMDGKADASQTLDNFGASNVDIDQHIYGPDAAAACQLVSRPADTEILEFYLRVQNVGQANVQGVVATFESNGLNTEVRLGTWDGSVYDVVTVESTASISSGDYVAASVVGDQIQAWHLPLGGDTWSLLATGTDSTYMTAGAVGFYFSDAVAEIDNFYAGTIDTGDLQETLIDETFKWIWTVRDLLPRFTDLYTPNWLQESDVALSLYTLYARTIEDLYVWLEDAGYQAIPHLATLTMPLWEEILDIAVSPNTSWIERRNLATIKRSVVYPEELRTEFFDVIRRLTGVLPSSIVEDYANYRIDLVTAAESGSRLARDLDRVIQERKPVGIQVNNNVTGFLADFGRADLDAV